jgi:hypothetical protein
LERKLAAQAATSRAIPGPAAPPAEERTAPPPDELPLSFPSPDAASRLLPFRGRDQEKTRKRGHSV